MPHFSIITINLNNAAGLRQTMDSVLAQSFPDFEYLVIDGGSTDGSVELIEKYAAKITYWVSERDAGIFDAMNKGIAAATGKYCLFLNSGDYLYQADVLGQVAKIGVSADVIYGDVIQSAEGNMLRRVNSPDILTPFFLLTGAVAHPAQFIRRDLFFDYGFYSTEYRMSSDYAFIVKLFFKTKFEYRHLPIPVAVFDLSGLSNHPANVTLYYNERRKIHKLYFPAWMALVYAGIVLIWRSPLFNNSLLARPIGYFRKSVMRFLGEEQINLDQAQDR